MSEAEELAKARLWVTGQRSIQASRIGVARTLQAPPGPAALVRAGFAPLVLALQEGREVAADRTEKVPVLAGEPLSVTLSTPGPQGLQGIPGPQGPATGAGGALLNYTHTQTVGASVWTVAHGLGFRPSVTIEDDTGMDVLADVAYTDLNTVTITFTIPLTGTAYLS